MERCSSRLPSTPAMECCSSRLRPPTETPVALSWSALADSLEPHLFRFPKSGYFPGDSGGSLRKTNGEIFLPREQSAEAETAPEKSGHLGSSPSSATM